MATLIKEVRLIKTEVESNNNKFWHGFLYDDGTVKAEWGRVGYSGDSGEWSGGAAYLDKKLNEKIKKGYSEQKTIASTTNLTPAVSVKNADLHSIAKTQLVKVSNPTLSKLIDRLVAANVHKITANTQITYNSTSGVFQTPLGVVTMDGLVQARNILADIAPHVRKQDYGSALNTLVSSYLRIIPQNVGMKLDVRRLLPNDDAIQKQSDLIDSLESSYQAIQTTPPKKSDGKPVEQVFKVDMDVLSDKKERDRLNNWFEKSKKSMHHYDNVRVKEIFVVNIHEMTNKYESNTSPHQEVFHGTSGANCLSILKSGLKVSPPSTAAIAGKLYGNGVYGSTCSSKSIGYTFGKWVSGSGIDHGYLFICDFAMGNIFYPKTYSASKPNGYDSIWALPKNTGLHNDELIVYRNNQIKIKYLLEIK